MEQDKSKQEGDRLIELFYNWQVMHKDEESTNGAIKRAKACAAICVKEIIAELDRNITGHDHYKQIWFDKWNKVLNYINEQK